MHDSLYIGGVLDVARTCSFVFTSKLQLHQENKNIVVGGLYRQQGIVSLIRYLIQIVHSFICKP